MMMLDALASLAGLGIDWPQYERKRRLRRRIDRAVSVHDGLRRDHEALLSDWESILGPRETWPKYGPPAKVIPFREKGS